MRLCDKDALMDNATVTRIGGNDYIALWRIDEFPEISPDSLRPKGRWVWVKNHYECSNCRGSRFHDLVLGLDAQYCGRCGADMRGEDEHGET